ncbi:MAG TPA: hypothetical protein VFP78_04665 [Solirubrobacteraceae bacterium]|nr:hypothetical protein [Solirubrobacteraceae bacterium]
MLLVLLTVAVVPFSVVACGDDDGDEATGTPTVTAPAGGGTSTPAANKGKIVKVELGESGSTYFVKPAQTKVEAGKVTFAVTNVGELYHEFIVYSNVDDVAAGDLPINEEEQEADLVEESIVGEAPYATPPIVPADKKPGDADHRIRGGGWGAELTVDLEAGKYILLCNLAGHYTNFKQYVDFTAE